jgi:hypothetical protein
VLDWILDSKDSFFFSLMLPILVHSASAVFLWLWFGLVTA